jgi:ketosteroid isomerase-like protein
VTGAELVSALDAAYQDRALGPGLHLLHPDAEVRLPATAERLVGREAAVSFQREYPEPWGTFRVLRVLSDPAGAVAELHLAAPQGPDCTVAAFWRTKDGPLHRGTEYWVDIGEGVLPGFGARHGGGPGRLVLARHLSSPPERPACRRSAQAPPSTSMVWPVT